jgi:S-adenosylmethionine/arginine decarboxylase-like enzyme
MWGYHLILDCAKCLPAKIRCKSNISEFARNLVHKIDMVPYGDPQVVHFGSGNKAGFTLVQLIETSNITGHFCDETGDAYLDIFSCKSFDPNIVKQVIQYHFQPESIDLKVISRQAGVPMEDHTRCCLNLR